MTIRMIRLACWLLVSAVVTGGVGTEVRCLAAEPPRCAVLEVFTRGDSEKSKAAQEFVVKTFGQRPGVHLVVRDVVADAKALDRFYKLADHFKLTKPGLPAFYGSGQFEVGWDAVTTPKRLEELFTVEVFVRSGCPRCAAAKPVIFDQIAPRYPGYKFVPLDIASSTDAGTRLNELSQRYGVQATSVPALHYCGQLRVGFFDAATSYRQWDDVLKAVTIVCPPAKSPQEKSQPDKTPQDKKVTEQRQPQHTDINQASAVPLWLVAVLFAQPAPETAAEEPPPRAPPPITATDSVATDCDAPPLRRAVPDEIPAETDPLALPPPPPTQSLETITLPVLGEVRWRDWGMPAFTIAVGLIDGFNPCAMWVLMFLLSLLVNLRDRLKILAVAGTFVFISGLAYFAFMTAWLSVAKLVIYLRPAQLTLGTIGLIVGLIHIKDFFAFKKGVSLSIPESSKPGLYNRIRRIVMAENLLAAIVGATVLAVLVNIIELLCTAGLPAMYTGILTMQKYPPWENYLYLLLYIAAYMFDDSVMVAIAVVTLGKNKLQERGGRMLKLLSGVVIAGLGAVMIFKPNWLGVVE